MSRASTFTCARQLDVADTEGHEPLGVGITDVRRDFGGKPCIVHVHSVPRCASSTVSIDVAVQRGQPSCTGKVWVPHTMHREPIRRGPSGVKTRTSGSTDLIAIPLI